MTTIPNLTCPVELKCGSFHKRVNDVQVISAGENIMRIVAASGAACSAPGSDKGCDPSLLHCSLTTSVNPCCTGLPALSDPNKNLSGTLPCFATLISPLNLGLGQVRMLLVSLATEMRMTFTLYFSVKKHF